MQRPTEFVVHISQPHDVYVGRPSMWGNPFKITAHAGRMQVIRQFRDSLIDRPHFVKLIRERLKGKTLACWCAPSPCHAEILAAIANYEGDEWKQLFD